MDPVTKPKKLRSFFVEDILGLNKTENRDNYGNCRSHLIQQNSSTHLHHPADSRSQLSLSSNCFQMEEDTRSDNSEWQGEECIIQFFVNSSIVGPFDFLLLVRDYFKLLIFN